MIYLYTFVTCVISWGAHLLLLHNILSYPIVESEEVKLQSRRLERIHAALIYGSIFITFCLLYYINNK